MQRARQPQCPLMTSRWISGNQDVMRLTGDVASSGSPRKPSFPGDGGDGPNRLEVVDAVLRKEHRFVAGSVHSLQAMETMWVNPEESGNTSASALPTLEAPVVGPRGVLAALL